MTARRGALPQGPLEPATLRIHRPEPPPEDRTGAWLAVVRAVRPHQWVKNLLLFLPLLLAHQVTYVSKWAALALAFVIFNACASAVYLLNDLLDLDADRRHPIKQHRPLAAGLLSVWQAAGMSAVLLALAFGASCWLMSPAFTGMLAIYVLLTTGYSLYFKRTLFLDVLLLAGLYTHRILTGGIVADVEVSHWLRVFSMFFFISLALVKRYVELRALAPGEQQHQNRRGYQAEDAELIQNIGLVSGYLSVLVLCLYISSSNVEKLYPHFSFLWLIAPALLYWITRIWLLARRNLLAADPVVVALTDLTSYLVGLSCAALVFMASL